MRPPTSATAITARRRPSISAAGLSWPPQRASTSPRSNASSAARACPVSLRGAGRTASGPAQELLCGAQHKDRGQQHHRGRGAGEPQHDSRQDRPGGVAEQGRPPEAAQPWQRRRARDWSCLPSPIGSGSALIKIATCGPAVQAGEQAPLSASPDMSAAALLVIGPRGCRLRDERRSSPFPPARPTRCPPASTRAWPPAWRAGVTCLGDSRRTAWRDPRG